jgi:uncharacterized protein (DUF2336 family)
MASSTGEYRAAISAQLTTDERVALARKVGLEVTALSSDEQQMLGEIVLLVARDAEERVRTALAETIAANPRAPHALVAELARDTDIVAAPILKLSEILTQEDLVALIESRISAEKMTAIAQRSQVPPAVCHTLAEIGGVDVAKTLLDNRGADIPESAYGLILDLYGHEPPIQAGVVARPSLPPRAISKAVRLISGALLARLIDRHQLPPDAARRLILDVKDQAILGFSTGLDAEGLTGLADQLISEDQLTPSLIFRSLVVGNVDFVIHAIALQCQLGVQHVRDRFGEPDNEPAAKLWKAARMPAEHAELLATVLDVLRDLRQNKRDWTPAYCRFRIIEKYASRYPSPLDTLDERDRAFLDAARDQALVDLSELE